MQCSFSLPASLAYRPALLTGIRVTHIVVAHLMPPSRNDAHQGPGAKPILAGPMGLSSRLSASGDAAIVADGFTVTASLRARQHHGPVLGIAVPRGAIWGRHAQQ